MLKEIFRPEGLPVNPILSPAIRHGNLVFTSGMVGREPGTGRVPDEIREQSRITLCNIEAVLQSAGSSLEHVLKITAFLTNLDDKAAFNEVYREFFTDNPPARTCIECGRLEPGFLVEVEAIAAIP